MASSTVKETRVSVTANKDGSIFSATFEDVLVFDELVDDADAKAARLAKAKDMTDELREYLTEANAEFVSTLPEPATRGAAQQADTTPKGAKSSGGSGKWVSAAHQFDNGKRIWFPSTSAVGSQAFEKGVRSKIEAEGIDADELFIYDNRSDVESDPESGHTQIARAVPKKKGKYARFKGKTAVWVRGADAEGGKVTVDIDEKFAAFVDALASVADDGDDDGEEVW